MAKYKFVLVGSGWRANYYMRIARALPEVFELSAIFCRSEERAQKVAEESGFYTTCSMDECIELKPDFVVVSVKKTEGANTARKWMDKGFVVIQETPLGLDLETLRNFLDRSKKGQRIVVAEQYTRYPSIRAILNVLDKRLIGDVSCLNLSVAHEYHGASIMRAIMGIKADAEYTVRAKTYEFPVIETLTRYDSFDDGRSTLKKRTLATVEFDNGKLCIYDFDSEQYRSPIRKNTIKVQGLSGELIDNTCYYLDQECKPHVSLIEQNEYIVETSNENPNLKRFIEMGNISFEGQKVYEPYFGLCQLSEDETAIAKLMAETGEYSRGNADSPYSIEDAIADARFAYILGQAIKSGNTENSLDYCIEE